ncbi:tetratricopeptide repeat protein [Cellvibrio japonicus]|uniref:Putative lipoprotein n=1 Tax=Cellvibrio japonicus (strain Ueda107) TaxID=498211 RepID=B3PCA5_CELJU|nr:tetratricopeptide repeat protein [Cellvibrio japonicus]ACE85010.1 putative lipoprotein [Cellvibrio japonicus Ueda107]QEI11816.1 hypothetical protein FY117_05925 [Cellvibrio japonicus]QEI15390.1 hypothetical protein FY116_05925 [Cellvibrio japonicus]QEI18969.1 hypothetical protein FY115_05925 [Cellvibrio japonicus]
MNWKLALVLLSLFVSSCSKENSSQGGFQAVHPCDEFAAHPNDPGRWAKGVEEEEIVPGPSIKSCRDAVADYPDTPRFHFQLGRVLLKNEQYEEAIESLTTAAESDYGPAFAYLADIYQSGLLGEADLETAESYYDIAIKSGFEPAIYAKQGLHDTDQEADGFDASKFTNGPILKALYDGDFDSLLQSNQFFISKYLVSLNSYFSEPFNYHDESCSSYAHPRIVRSLGTNQLEYLGVGLDGSMEERAESGLALTLKIFASIAQDGGSELMKAGMDIAELEAAANRDGVLLARTYGCENPVFIRLYENLESYATKQPPKHFSGLPKLNHECQKSAAEKGGNVTNAKRICTCFTNQFLKNNVDEGDINWLAQNYDQGGNFKKTIKKYPGLDNAITACLIN